LHADLQMVYCDPHRYVGRVLKDGQCAYLSIRDEEGRPESLFKGAPRWGAGFFLESSFFSFFPFFVFFFSINIIYLYTLYLSLYSL